MLSICIGLLGPVLDSLGKQRLTTNREGPRICVSDFRVGKCQFGRQTYRAVCVSGWDGGAPYMRNREIRDIFGDNHATNTKVKSAERKGDIMSIPVPSLTTVDF